MSAARYTSRRTPSRPSPEEWCSDYRGFSALLCHTITRCLVAWGEFVASVRIRIGRGYRGGDIIGLLVSLGHIIEVGGMVYGVILL